MPLPAGPCTAWQVEYATTSSVMLSDTTMGAGDGVYPNGPGKVVLQFEDKGGQPGGRAILLEYQVHDTFVLDTHVLAWETRVVTDMLTRIAPGAKGFAAEGALEGRSIRWIGPWNGMHSDGNVTCTGSFCGKFGAPPEGRSEMHVPMHQVTFKPFEFAPDMKTFTMAYSVVYSQSHPSQTTRIAIAGREVKRTCIAPPPPPAPTSSGAP
jgi:hypothetical protein